MPYYPNVPAATQQINNSQPQIQANFQEIQTGFSVDHVPYGTGGATEGFHRKISIPVWPAGPLPVFPAGTIGLYNRVHAGSNQLYVKTGAAAAIPMTEQAFTAGTNGYTYLPSGLVMKFGTQKSIGIPSRAIINLNGIGPNYAQTPFVNATGGYSDTIIPPIPGGTTNLNTCVIYSVTAAQLIVATYLENFMISWFAIGPV